MTVYRPDHQDWHDLLGSECTCEEAWAGRGMVDDRCWYHRTIDVLDDHDMGRLLDKVLYEIKPRCQSEHRKPCHCDPPSISSTGSLVQGGFLVQVYPEVTDA